MTARIIKMVDSREGAQTWRFRWREAFNGFYVYDSQPMQEPGSKLEFANSIGMGDGVDMFCDENGEDCLVPGTQRFYDALNGYFEGEQAEIAKAYFDIDLEEGRRQIS